MSKSKGKSNKKKSIFQNPILIILLITIFMISTMYGFFSTEFVKKPYVKEKIREKDYSYLYDFYLSSKPSIDNRVCFGDQKAPITMIVYIDPISSVSEKFFFNEYIQLKKDYIDTGVMKFCPKNFLNIEDYNGQTERFINGKKILCFNSLKPNNFSEIYFDFIGLSNKSSNSIMQKYNILEDDFDECMINIDESTLIEDISEVSNQGIVLNPRFYFGINSKENTIIEGIPTYTKFKNTINNYKTYVGLEIIEE